MKEHHGYAAATPNAEELRRSLAAIGIVARVEARDRLAVLTVIDATVLREPEWRRRALGLARELGFTNLAVEIGEDTTTRAALSRD